jgi:MFS transporter, DHA2 family, multidrug resistance protein
VSRTRPKVSDSGIDACTATMGFCEWLPTWKRDWRGIVPNKAGRREWLGLAVIALPCLLYSMDLTVLNLAVPSLSADLAPSSAQLLWIVDIYGFLVAGSLITMGTLGDRIGRRRLLLIGAAAFGFASVLAAFSRSAEMLITTRALLGLAGATLAPSTLSLIRNMFLDPRQRTIAIGVWISSYSAGGAIGPFIGGLLLEHFWWGSVFPIGVPVMVLLLVVGPVLLPEFRDPGAGRLDVVSAVLSMACLLPVIYGLKQLAQEGPGWLPVATILAGVGVGVLFVRRQQRLADPLLDLRLFRSASFSVALASYTVASFVTFGVFLFIAQYLSPLRAGLWTAPFAGAFIVGSLVTPAIARLIRPGFVLAAGLALSTVGFGLLMQVDRTSGLALLVIGFVLFCLALAPVFTLATDLIVAGAPLERAGAAAAISETGSELGGALGIAILGSIGAAVYRGHMTDILPAGAAPETLNAMRGTLGGAIASAGQFPTERALAIVDAAREAFTFSLQLSAGISAVLVTLTAIVAAALLRHVRITAESGSEADGAQGVPAVRSGDNEDGFESTAAR